MFKVPKSVRKWNLIKPWYLHTLKSLKYDFKYAHPNVPSNNMV